MKSKQSATVRSIRGSDSLRNNWSAAGSPAVWSIGIRCCCTLFLRSFAGLTEVMSHRDLGHGTRLMLLRVVRLQHCGLNPLPPAAEALALLAENWPTDCRLLLIYLREKKRRKKLWILTCTMVMIMISSKTTQCTKNKLLLFLKKTVCSVRLTAIICISTLYVFFTRYFRRKQSTYEVGLDWKDTRHCAEKLVIVISGLDVSQVASKDKQS